MSAPVPPPYQGQPAQPSKKAWYKKKRIIIPAALIVVVAVASSGGGGGSSDGDGEPAAQTTTATGGNGAPAKAPAASKPAAAKPAEATYAGKTDDDKLASAGSVQLTGFTATAATLAKTSSALEDTLLCTKVTMLNRDDKAQDYSLTSWKLQTPDGQVLDASIFGDNNLDLAGTLAPEGKVTNKNVCFAFDDGTIAKGQYVMSWLPDQFSSKDRGIWLQKF